MRLEHVPAGDREAEGGTEVVGDYSERRAGGDLDVVRDHHADLEEGLEKRPRVPPPPTTPPSLAPVPKNQGEASPK